MRFRVTVHAGNGLQVPLGEWSGCSGLAVNLKIDEYAPGGTHEGVQRFPDRVTYGNVSLERAMQSASSDALQKWLQHVIKNWVDSDEAGASAANPGSTITIEMLSARDWAPIYVWTLADAIPVGWSGPTLSAKGGDVALEKLVLAHNGLTGRRHGGPPPAMSPPRRGQRTGKDGNLTVSLLSSTGVDATDTDVITFQYNPQKVSLSKTAQFRLAGMVSTETREQQAIDPGQLSITLSDLRVEGVKAVQATVSKLYEWLRVETVTSGPAAGGGEKAGDDEPKQVVQHVKVVMGAAGIGGHRTPINYRAILKSVSTTYTRFTPAGLPNRATVSLTLQQIEPAKPGTNPTSGTRESGRAHTVTAGESLPGIAKETYGSPSAWRKIAEENDIDDPLRLRNGSSLLLPGVA
ncbi:phage tail protein [Amycolatopsis sp. H20-H5]|uniref:phage tail protein n=1 Tax=Amycolatopsis sp. H20-H5 TaxID=3046309 RepID=UPI002DB7528A|nr:phage tail protein [Amycolatopsis sp. H20-H5]MEC3981859.1 phage tail protein [Amycolatopsis sp. H20-H5]